MHVVCVGGSDAGISAGLRARELDPSTEVTVVVADAYPNFSICGIPYYISGEVGDWHHLAHRTRADLEAAGLHLLLDTRATRIDVDARQLEAIGPDDTPITPQHVADMLARLYYDTAMAGAPVSLLPTLQITDISHVLFGTDWPAAPEPTVARTIDQLVHAGLTADELHAIEYGNTAKLLSRFG